MSRCIILMLLGVLGASPLHAATLRVGAGGDVPSIAEAARLARDGDTVLILPGTYRGDVAVWQQKRLTIVGGHPRPILEAAGKSAEDKAIWVLRAGDFVVRNIEFRGARVADGNGAGIRFERGTLEVDNCVFRNNQNGILTANFADAQLRIHDSLFADAPQQLSPLPHLLYIGQIGSAEIRGSTFTNGFNGHLIKSRAAQTVLEDNLIVDAPSGRASYEVDLPNGGVALLRRNTIGQSVYSRNPVIIAYGAEGSHWPENRLELHDNTLLGPSRSDPLRIWQARLLPAATVTIDATQLHWRPMPGSAPLRNYNDLALWPLQRSTAGAIHW